MIRLGQKNGPDSWTRVGQAVERAHREDAKSEH